MLSVKDKKHLMRAFPVSISWCFLKSTKKFVIFIQITYVESKSKGRVFLAALAISLLLVTKLQSIRSKLYILTVSKNLIPYSSANAWPFDVGTAYQKKKKVKQSQSQSQGLKR